MRQNEKPQTKAVDDDPDYSRMTERGPDGRVHKTAETEAGESVSKTAEDLPQYPTHVRSNPD